MKALVFHGLRKTATGNLAEAGCTSEQIKAITGHKTDRMVSHYVAGAKQKEPAKAAMAKLDNVQGLRLLHPFNHIVILIFQPFLF
ncbi:MAG: hypothetical protein PHW63_02140 [Alphaproteobacteria bacterium]|nr:hypothetical protein [Alphaproteobacteria bacterium]